MNCGQIRELLSAQLDGRLTPDEEAALSGHLAACEECRREQAALAKTVSILRGLAPVEAPAGLPDRVRRRLAAPRRRMIELMPFLALPSVRMAMAAGVVLALGFLGIWYAEMISSAPDREGRPAGSARPQAPPQEIQKAQVV